MRRIYFIGIIMYTLIVLHVAFPNIFSFEDVGNSTRWDIYLDSICSRFLYFDMAFEKKTCTR